jgi:nickel/cobalt exporter
MINLSALLIGAAVVGVLHMLAPDHWATLCLLGQSFGWSGRRLFGVSLVTATGHAVFSAALGLGIVAVGLVFSRLISLYLSFSIGVIMLAIGLFIGIRSLVSKQKREVTPEEKLMGRQKDKGTIRLNGISYFAVLGAALSPDLSITPVFLAAIPAGLLFGVYLFIVFVVASILCQLILVQVGIRGFAKTFEHIPEKYNDAIVGFVIAAIGIFIIVTA